MTVNSPISRLSAWYIVLSVAVGVLLGGCAGTNGTAKKTTSDPPAASASDPPAPAGDPSSLSAGAQEGKKLFDTVGCMGCHAVHGQGGKVGPDLSNEGNSGHSDQWLATQIRDPRKNDPGTIMPAFNNLTSQKVNDLVAYLKSLKTGNSQNGGRAKTIARTTASRPRASAASTSIAATTSGGELWGKTCGQCHNLRPPSEFSDAQWAVAVHHMRIRAPLTGEQQRSILGFLQASN